MHTFRTVVASLLGATLVLSAQAADDSSDIPGWHFLWGDEFNGAAVDPALWRTEDAGLVKNNELQYYAPDDAYVADGSLVLRAQRRSLGGRDYTAGLVESKGKFALQYGRVEFRLKIPQGQGLWPAVWMLPADGSWPPEIDITEHVGSQPNAVTMTYHYGSWPDHEWDTETHIEDATDYSADYHVYALEWDEAEIRWYVDGVQRHSVKENLPHEPFYLILNLAVGGDMPGDPDETTPFPSYMYVDYIRAYGKELPGTFFLTTAADNGRIAITPWKHRYATGDNVTLRATPKIGHLFTGWSGDAAGTNREIKLAMDQHRNVRAEFAPDPDAPPLISAGKPATSSSVEENNDELGPAGLTDGKRSTRWSSAFNDKEWAIVDLGAVHAIKAIRLDWENAYGKAYDVQVSDDAKTWKTVFTQADGKGGPEEILLDASGRYVRLLGKQRATDWGWSLFEMEVFGSAPPAVP